MRQEGEERPRPLLGTAEWRLTAAAAAARGCLLLLLLLCCLLASPETAAHQPYCTTHTRPAPLRTHTRNLSSKRSILGKILREILHLPEIETIWACAILYSYYLNTGETDHLTSQAPARQGCVLTTKPHRGTHCW